MRLLKLTSWKAFERFPSSTSTMSCLNIEGTWCTNYGLTAPIQPGVTQQGTIHTYAPDGGSPEGGALEGAGSESSSCTNPKIENSLALKQESINI